MNTVNFSSIDALMEHFSKQGGSSDTQEALTQSEEQHKEQRELVQEFNELLERLKNMEAAGQITPEIQAQLSSTIQAHYPKSLQS